MANVDKYANSSGMSDSSGTSGDDFQRDSEFTDDDSRISELTDFDDSRISKDSGVISSTSDSIKRTDADNKFLNNKYTNYVALLGMYAEGSRAQSDSFNAKLSKYKCVLFEIKEMHAIGASISQPTDNTDRSVFKQRVDGSSDIQLSLNKSGLKIYAATKATVQLVFGYKKTDSGIQASGRMQIVPSTSTPNSSIIVSQFSIKDNKIMGLSKGSSSVAKVMSLVLDADITTDTDVTKTVDPVITPSDDQTENMQSTGDSTSGGGRKSKRNKRVKKGKTRKMLKGGKTHRKMKGCKTKSKSRKINL